MDNEKDIQDSHPVYAARWLTLWMRIVGSFYLFLFLATAILKLPIQTLAPEGTLEKAAVGDGVARFLVDTWFILGLAIGSIGVSLWLASFIPAQSKILIRTVIGFELIWGIGADIYQICRGHPIEKIIPWIFIHMLIITTGILTIKGTEGTKHK